MGQIASADSNTFEQLVLKSEKPVVVDFWAEWCGPCRALAPVLEEVATELTGKAEVIKVNVDLANDLAAKYGIRGIPTMIFFKDGQVKQTLVGLQPKEEILSTLKGLV